MAWLKWLQTLTTVSQRGLAYSKDPYDLENYTKVREVCAEMAEHGAPEGMPAVRPILDAQTGYPTPKVDVRAVVVKNGQLLFVKETQDGKWALPGGWADLGVSPASVATKEVHEEAGFEVTATRLLGVFGKQLDSQRVFSVYKLIFHCELVGGAAKPSHETSEVAFFSRDALPPLSMHRTHPRHLEQIFLRLDDPTLPTYFE